MRFPALPKPLCSSQRSSTPRWRLKNRRAHQISRQGWDTSISASTATANQAFAAPLGSCTCFFPRGQTTRKENATHQSLPPGLIWLVKICCLPPRFFAPIAWRDWRLGSPQNRLQTYAWRWLASWLASWLAKLPSPSSAQRCVSLQRCSQRTAAAEQDMIVSCGLGSFHLMTESVCSMLQGSWHMHLGSPCRMACQHMCLLPLPIS